MAGRSLQVGLQVLALSKVLPKICRSKNHIMDTPAASAWSNCRILRNMHMEFFSSLSTFFAVHQSLHAAELSK